jgi:hypothetical protein
LGEQTQNNVSINEICEENGKITKPMKIFYQNLKLNQVVKKIQIKKEKIGFIMFIRLTD